jgi:hypothetical protein
VFLYSGEYHASTEAFYPITGNMASDKSLLKKPGNLPQRHREHREHREFKFDLEKINFLMCKV